MPDQYYWKLAAKNSIPLSRSGEDVDKLLLNSIQEMFKALGIYFGSFEQKFLKCTEEFYAAEGEEFMQHSSVPDYLKHVGRRLSEELERCSGCLDPRTRKLSLKIAEEQLLGCRIPAILNKGFTMLMDESYIEDLQSLYALFSRVDALDSLRQALSLYIMRKGEGMIIDENKDEEMVDSLLEFYCSIDTIWKESFFENFSFGNTIKDAFGRLMNLRENRPVELLAKSLDKRFRAGTKGIFEEELKGTIDKHFALFRFIQGKDLFEEFYKKDLSKRLLSGKSASVDVEKYMISKLETECGDQFTENLKNMYQDIELSVYTNKSFEQSSQVGTELSTGIKMRFHVLGDRRWPTFLPTDVRLPPELIACQDTFEEFYIRKNKHKKKLTWINSLSQCVLKAHFPNGEKELRVSLFQTLVLQLFNDADKLSFQDIKDSTGIEDEELRRTLQSLACGKVRLLNKIPRGKDVENDDLFEYNNNFTADPICIKVSSIKGRETLDERKRSIETVIEWRKVKIRAAVARLVKAKTEMRHSDLVAELPEELNFPVDTRLLKAEIDVLLDQGFIERDKVDSQMYKYCP